MYAFLDFPSRDLSFLGMITGVGWDLDAAVTPFFPLPGLNAVYPALAR
jgi:hypothetical protein